MERAATAGIEPGTSSSGVARSTAELPRPPNKKALPTNPFGGMGAFKEMLADDHRVLVGLYISITS